MNLLKKWLVYLLNKITIFIVTFRFRAHLNTGKLTRLGSVYGGWWIPTDFLQKFPDRRRLLISAGLGHDVTFDIEMCSAGFTILGLDPTEDAFAYASEIFENDTDVRIFKKGLWTSSGIHKFYKPKIASHDSFSITNSQNQQDYLQLETITISEILNLAVGENDFELKILKMDIEGAEVPVLKGLLEQNIRFDFIAAEIDYLSVIPFIRFHQRLSAIVQVLILLKRMKKQGYSLIQYEYYNFFWIENSHIARITKQDTI
jgi:FkbM family methyltransferase